MLVLGLLRKLVAQVKTTCSCCASTHSFTPTLKATALVVQLQENWTLFGILSLYEKKMVRQQSAYVILLLSVLYNHSVS